MGILYLVRHAQASFGAEDYDQLSSLGERQSQRLGQYFASKRLHFDAVCTGTLRRHAQTLQGISTGLGTHLAARAWSGLDEYKPDAVIAAVHPEALPRGHDPESYRQYFKLLRMGLIHWMLGNTQPQGMPSWHEFTQEVLGVLEHVRDSGAQRVLVVTSGGPIACALGQVLGTPAEATAELNMRLRNSSVTELSFSASRYSLQTYNTLSHLDQPDLNDWITYA